MRAPEASGSERRYVAPSTATEVTLAHIAADVLGLPRVGLDDNFFELGGHSLSATRLATRLAEALVLDVPVRVVFETPRLADLAAALEAAQLAQSDEAALREMLADLDRQD